MKNPLKLVIISAALAACAAVANAEDGPLTPGTLRLALAGLPPAGDPALADRVRAYFGADTLAKGAKAKVEGLDAAWAIEVTDEAAATQDKPPRIVSEDDSFALPLTRIAPTGIYAGAVALADGTAMRWAYEVGGRRLGWSQLEAYAPRLENQRQPDVPVGTLTQQPPLQSKTFPGTTRDWWVFVPAQYKPDAPACVMFFQDGGGMKNWVPTTFENLIARGEMPVTVGIFINPGVFEDKRPNRGFEYDTLSDQYARFLLDEILPLVEKGGKPLNLRHDAAGRAICGISSGGICSFTAAWERPDQFSKVLSFVGSFTNIASGESRREGGHNYPALIRKTDPKPIRVFLQDGENDLDNAHGNWPLANQEMAKALAFAQYDYKFVFGRGFHSDQHGRAILPDALRWLWRD